MEKEVGNLVKITTKSKPNDIPHQVKAFSTTVIANNDKPKIEETEESEGGDINDDKTMKRRNFSINQVFETMKGGKAPFPNNTVTTTKYTCLNFFPKNLFVQFSKMANAYFLFLILLQLIPKMAPTPTAAAFTLMPLCFVVGISMIKDAYEDN